MFSGWETVIIGIIIIAIIIWGPQKLPELARSIGQAKKEFEKASRGEIEASSASDPDKKILELAKELGIDTAGKTKEEILKEIAEKTSKK